MWYTRICRLFEGARAYVQYMRARELGRADMEVRETRTATEIERASAWSARSTPEIAPNVLETLASKQAALSGTHISIEIQP